MSVTDLKIGQSATILNVYGTGALHQHLLDMGLIPGTFLTVIKYAPMGDPVELMIHGYELTIRLEDASRIEVMPLDSEYDHRPDQNRKLPSLPHPGLGEEGKYHDETKENPLPDDTVLTFALVGNQNCGKTTLFNQLTGSSQHVGNFPGVTVDRKSGTVRNHPYSEITDLPGIYSLSAYTAEEIVTRQFVLDEKPKGIINIVDATNIERNLYLTMQLLEMDIPMVLALNMMDEVKNNGGYIDVNTMEDILGIPVVPISAARNEGVDELIRHAIHVAKYQETPRIADFCDDADHGGAVHRCLHGIRHLIYDHAQKAGISPRFAATKLAENDSVIREKLVLDPNEEELVEHIVSQMEQERELDRNAAVADMRFSFIQKLVKETVVKPRVSREQERSRKLDDILTGKYTAIPVFIAIMGIVFYLTFHVIGAFLQSLMETGIDSLMLTADRLLTGFGTNPVVHSLVIDGIFSGVGSVLSFLPVIVTLFFFLSLLEDTGYMARVAFIMDKLLRKIGLSGRSIVPMLIGFGCTVPGVMATRTLPSNRDRIMTVLLTPFMSCSAKLPIYGLFCGLFFPDYAALVMIAIYLLGIVIGILVALVLKNTMFQGEAVPFVMELPNYRLPGIKNVAMLLWEKAKDFLQKAFTIIFMAAIVIWFLQTFDIRLCIVSDSKDSILALISGFLAPLFVPLGFGNWRMVTSLVTGFIAKESVVSTLTVLYGSEAMIASAMTVSSVLPFLAFCLLYTPCVAAIASVKRELGMRWAVCVVTGQCVIAYCVAFAVRLLCLGAGL
ncbi:MAG: ferrous iron transport protein B [Erysipelotrichaceae bacterium]|nr:ferrous iron transport protein B [Erysipelotrichaceae bacterium]